MNRRALAAMLATATLVVGCARTRAALPPRPNQAPDALPIPVPAPVPGPAEITPLEPIRASINQGKIPTDASTVRASYVEPSAPAEADDPAPTPPPSRPAPPTRPAEASSKPAASTPPPAPERKAEPDVIGLKTDPGLEPGERVARTAAIVGGTVITDRMLALAICNHLEIPPGELKNIPTDRFVEIARGTLDGLIDNALLLQEAQREMKKNWKMFSEYAEKSWREKEIPMKLRKYDAEDAFALRKKLEAMGDSLDDQQDIYKQNLMARDFLMVRLQPKVDRPGKPELEAYYSAHRNDPMYHREARVSWREILVAAENPSELPKARQSAAALRSRLTRGEDFATLARSSSAGATAEKGGAWETSPGGHPVPAINAALASLKFGEVSAPIEGPKGVYLVRVERRTVSGPASFVEVQKQIAETLFQERFKSLVEAYLKKLREKTTIASRFNKPGPATASEPARRDPDARRTGGP